MRALATGATRSLPLPRSQNPAYLSKKERKAQPTEDPNHNMKFHLCVAAATAFAAVCAGSTSVSDDCITEDDMDAFIKNWLILI